MTAAVIAADSADNLFVISVVTGITLRACGRRAYGPLVILLAAGAALRAASQALTGDWFGFWWSMGLLVTAAALLGRDAVRAVRSR